MKIFLIVLGSIIGFLLILFLIIGLIGYRKLYRREKVEYDVLTVPEDKFPFPGSVLSKCREFRATPHEEIYITSPRGHKLYGELRKSEIPQEGTPTIILFAHGFKSSGSNDEPLFGNFQMKKYDLLTIDHEGCGLSEGKCSGFGVYEQENIRLWVKKINKIYDHKVNIFLHGVSMGCNSVLLTASYEMENVKGIIGDCGYVSTFKMVRCLVKLNILSFMICLFNSMVLRKNIFKYSTLKTLKESKYPILLIHGAEDKFVPTYMSVLNDKACTSKHKLVFFEGATHAMSYLSNPSLYEDEFDSFILENK